MILMKRRGWMVSNCCGHVERIGEGKVFKRVFIACMESSRRRGRLQRRWIDEVKELLVGRRLSEVEVELLAKTGKPGIGWSMKWCRCGR